MRPGVARGKGRPHGEFALRVAATASHAAAGGGPAGARSCSDSNSRRRTLEEVNRCTKQGIIINMFMLAMDYMNRKTRTIH